MQQNMCRRNRNKTSRQHCRYGRSLFKIEERFSNAYLNLTVNCKSYTIKTVANDHTHAEVDVDGTHVMQGILRR